MQRYFAKEKIADNLILYDSDIHHIKKVMRYQIGDEIEVVNDNLIYLCKLTNLSPIELEVLETYTENREMTTSTTVAIALVNEQKMDLILQKLTELGVDRFIPIITERSIIKLDSQKETKKIARWQMICKEASEQSKRTKIPQVENIITLNELIKKDYPLKLICSLASNTKPLNDYLKTTDANNILFVIGPEGGFTKNEEEKLINANFQPVTLGKRVLRVETAAIYIASVINYICEE